MKILKKISYIVLALSLFCSQLVVPDFIEDASAKSLNDMRAELAELEKEYADYQSKQEATEEDIAEAKETVSELGIEKEEIEEEIEDLTAEIKNLEAEIISKNDDMKDIIRYYQLSSSEDAYLEYLFTSTDFTDFIYRMAIAEQLSDYNESLINEYNDLIDKNEAKKENLSNKIVELDKKTLELEDKLLELGDELSNTLEGSMSVENEMKSIRRTIEFNEKFYAENKCDPDMEYEACVEKANTLPPGTGFYRPVTSGRVSSNWGKRSFILNGKPYSDFHYGIDFSSSHGSKIYAASEGQVAHVINAKAEYKRTGKNQCGGNMVFINHKVNGVNYTTGYFHLATIKVKEGEIVTSNTVIGTMGGTSKEYWDNCSTGAHVHFQIAKGYWGNQYKSYSGFTSKSFNPRKVLNAPALGKSFSNRKTKY